MKRIFSIMVVAVALTPFALQNAKASIIVNSFGLAAPQHTVTFSELSFPNQTVITNQFKPYGVSLSPGHLYNSQDYSDFPGITGDFVGVSQGIPFSILFNGPVFGAAFGYAKNPTTVLVEALLDGNIVESFSQAVTFDNPATSYLGFDGILLDEIRVTADVDEGLVDNVQFNGAVPEPTTLLLWSIIAGAGLVFSSRHRKVARRKVA